MIKLKIQDKFLPKLEGREAIECIHERKNNKRTKSSSIDSVLSINDSKFHLNDKFREISLCSKINGESNERPKKSKNEHLFFKLISSKLSSKAVSDRVNKSKQTTNNRRKPFLTIDNSISKCIKTYCAEDKPKIIKNPKSKHVGKIFKNIHNINCGPKSYLLDDKVNYILSSTVNEPTKENRNIKQAVDRLKNYLEYEEGYSHSAFKIQNMTKIQIHRAYRTFDSNDQERKDKSLKRKVENADSSFTNFKINRTNEIKYHLRTNNDKISSISLVKPNLNETIDSSKINQKEKFIIRKPTDFFMKISRKDHKLPKHIRVVKNILEDNINNESLKEESSIANKLVLDQYADQFRCKNNLS